MYIVQNGVDVLGQDFGAPGTQVALGADIMVLLAVLDKLVLRGSSASEGWNYTPSKGTDLSGLYEMETIHA